MRKRNNSFLIRLSEKEYERLQKYVLKTGLSREALIRALLSGYHPKELPPLDYHTLIQELHSIGVNLNQIAAKANATGNIDKAIFQYEANRLRRAILDIQTAFTSPEKRCDDGNHSDLGRERPS